MAATVEFKIEVKGIKELVERSKKIEKDYIRGMNETANRRVVNKMRQKLQLMFPGSRLVVINENSSLKITVGNIAKSSQVVYDKALLELTSHYAKIKANEFERLGDK